MAELFTELNPLRIVLGKTKSVDLLVQITNDSDKPRTISCDVSLGDGLGFEKNGLSKSKVLRLGKLKVGEKTTNYFSVFPRPNLSKGLEKITVIVTEHFEESYDYILSKKTKQLFLRIE